MTNQLTTIAALPNGAGRAANLAPEVGERPARAGYAGNLQAMLAVACDPNWTPDERLCIESILAGNGPRLFTGFVIGGTPRSLNFKPF